MILTPWRILLTISLALAAQKAPIQREPLTGMEFVRVSGGSFTMGCSDNDRYCDTDEQPAHKVRLSKPFEMGKYEVTQAQWKAVMTDAPEPVAADLPVDQVSWDDIQVFLQKLNAQHSGYHYRLPTEAEWEYAARSGNDNAVNGELEGVAWYKGDSGDQPHAVGQKKANRWGLFDMEGNVWEWVQDFYDEYYYAKSPGKDPKGPDRGQPVTIGGYSGPAHVLRGGSWNGDAKVNRVSYRSWGSPNEKVVGFGFRCVREPL